jgi:hypothetical protein
VRRTSTRGRVLGLVGAIALGVVATVAAVYFTGGGGEAPSGDYTPINRQMQLAARDVMRAVTAWRRENGPPEPDPNSEQAGEPSAPPTLPTPPTTGAASAPAAEAGKDGGAGTAGASQAGAAQDGAGAGAAPLTDGGEGPIELTVELHEWPTDELPDDLGLVLCPDIKAWIGVIDATAFRPVMAARSASTLRGDVVLYDGHSVVTVPASKAPAWVNATGSVALTKRDLGEGADKSVTFTR